MYFFAQSLYYLAKLKKNALLYIQKVPKKEKKKGGKPLFSGFCHLNYMLFDKFTQTIP